MNKSLTTIFLFTFIVSGLLSIDEPKEPLLPKVPDETRDVRGDKASAKEETEYSITAKFCDDREVKGKWKLHSTEFSFSHTKNRIQYTKTLKVSDLSSISILSWKMTPLREKKDGTPYQISPEDIRITAKDGEEFFKKSLKGTEFMEILLENKNGQTKLFTYWIDMLLANSKWHSGLPVVQGDTRTDCHPDVIRQIIFNQPQN